MLLGTSHRLAVLTHWLTLSPWWHGTHLLLLLLLLLHSHLLLHLLLLTTRLGSATRLLAWHWPSLLLTETRLLLLLLRLLGLIRMLLLLLRVFWLARGLLGFPFLRFLSRLLSRLARWFLDLDLNPNPVFPDL